MKRTCFTALSALALASCSSSSDTPAKEPSGVLVVALSSDLMVPGDLDVLELEVTCGGTTPLFQTWALPGDAKLPGTLTLVTTVGDAANVPRGTIAPNVAPVDAGACRVTARAKHGAVTVVTRTADVTMSAAMRHQLSMPLEKACLSIPCADGTTCAAGTCVAAAVDVSKLPAP